MLRMEKEEDGEEERGWVCFGFVSTLFFSLQLLFHNHLNRLGWDKWLLSNDGCHDNQGCRAPL